jgi:hypothetical protein
MTKEIDSFLDGEDAGQAEAVEQPSAADTPHLETADPPAEAGSGPVMPEPAKPAEETDDVHPATEDVVGLKSALQAERAKRRDYKGERDRLAGEVAALRAEVEARRAPAAVAPSAHPPEPTEPPAAVAVPSPLEDPAGYHAFVQRALFNERLNTSEAMLRAQLDNDADIDAKLAVFKKAADANPALRAELTRQPNPYRWAYQQAQRIIAMDEIGTDPAAYRTKVEAEIEARVRAAVEAEYAAAAPPGAPPRVHLPQSLGTARSASPRNAAVINVPESFDDILALGKR